MGDPARSTVVRATTARYHGDVERLGHHGDEHVEKENAGGNIVQAEQQMTKAFDISQFNLENGESYQAEQRPKQRRK